MSLMGRFLALLFVASLGLSAPAHADTAAQNVVRKFYAELVSTMKQGPALGFNGRYKKLDPAIRAAFNLPLMTKMALGSKWSVASAQEQNNLTTAFSHFSISTYANRFASFDGEEFLITGEKASGSNVIVETTLKVKNGESVTLNYLMRADEKGAFRIVDVFMNGTISELATRRSEFSSIVQREGIPALVNSLQDKAKQMSAS